MARLRSPNYPGISLPKAISLVEEIYKKNHQNVITRDAAAKDIGYSGLTGRSIKLLAALNQYGLLEKSGKGHVTVTDRAKHLIYDIEPEEKLQAAKAAGREPQLFADIFERFPDEARSVNAIRSFLGQKGFTEKAMKPAITSFEETNQYIELLQANESYSSDDESGTDSDPDQPIQEQNEMQQAATNPASPPPAGGVDAVFWSKGDLDFNFSSSGLAVAGKTNSKSALEAYIKKLEALVVLLPDDEDQQ